LRPLDVEVVFEEQTSKDLQIRIPSRWSTNMRPRVRKELVVLCSRQEVSAA
jgi:hypothetical protein